MIHVFIGTKAQLIKMAPLLVEMQQRRIAFRYVDSGQHAEISQSLRNVFDLAEPDVSLRRERGDIVSIPAALNWYLRHYAASWFRRAWLKQQVFPGGGVCLIHGDTLSTLMGMQLAKAAGLDVAHVEAGLRSFKIWDPFPEELIRIRCMRRADFLFAPSDEAAENLKTMRVRGQVVQVNGNTVADALRLIEGAPAHVDFPSSPFALATCHRLETISKRSMLEKVVHLLNRTAKLMPVVFVRHKPTRKYLERFGLLDQLHENIDCRDMLDYSDFIKLVTSARIVLADGGSIQEECAYLNKPCLILRRVTERPDGLGANARLWKFEDSVADEFFEFASSFQPNQPAELPQPSARIVDTLVEMGYADADD